MEIVGTTGLAVWAVVSGIGFGLLGVAYRLGQARDVTPTQIGLVIGVVGCAVFGWRAHDVQLPAPTLVWALGIAVGVSQYLVMKLIGPALRRGPLSPLWCAVNLGFVVAVVYAALFLRERPSVLQCAGMAAAVGSVAAASVVASRPSGATGAHHGDGGRVTYGLLLAVILVLNGLSPAFLKRLSAGSAPGGTLVTAFGDLYYLVFYAVFALLILADLTITGAIRGQMGRAIGVGLLGGAGSAVGMGAWALASRLPAVTVFTISSVVSLLVASVISVTAFGERRTAAWYVTVGLAVGAVVLVNG